MSISFLVLKKRTVDVESFNKSLAPSSSTYAARPHSKLKNKLQCFVNKVNRKKYLISLFGWIPLCSALPCPCSCNVKWRNSHSHSAFRVRILLEITLTWNFVRVHFSFLIFSIKLEFHLLHSTTTCLCRLACSVYSKKECSVVPCLRLCNIVSYCYLVSWRNTHTGTMDDDTHVAYISGMWVSLVTVTVQSNAKQQCIVVQSTNTGRVITCGRGINTRWCFCLYHAKLNSFPVQYELSPKPHHHCHRQFMQLEEPIMHHVTPQIISGFYYLRCLAWLATQKTQEEVETESHNVER